MWSPKINRLHYFSVIIWDITYELFAQMRLNFLQLDVAVLAPAIHNDMNFAAGVIEPIKNLQRPFGAANARDIQGKNQENIISQIECRHCHWIKAVLEIDNNVFISLTQ